MGIDRRVSRAARFPFRENRATISGMPALASFRSSLSEKMGVFASFFVPEPTAGSASEAAANDGMPVRAKSPFVPTVLDRLNEVLVEIAVRVYICREEGISFAPAVFFGNDLDHLLETCSGTKPLPIGEGSLDVDTARVALKSCLPLGEGRQWAVYFIVDVPKEGDLDDLGTLRFGLFCTDRSPLRGTSFQALRAHPDPDRPTLGFTRLGDSVVEVHGCGAYQYLDFSGIVDFRHNPLTMVTGFVSSVTRDAIPALRRQLEAYYYRIAIEIGNSRHGALIVILRAGQEIPEFLLDGIWLDTPIDIAGEIEAYGKDRNESATLSLIAYGSLIRKMVAMDGVTVLTSDGSVLAYNCFIQDQVVGAPARHVMGGARRRAFELLCSYLGATVKAVLYRSQDGAAECREYLEP